MIKSKFAYFPRFEVPISHWRFMDTQFLHGCISTTLQRIRRALQDRQARFARFLGGGSGEDFGGIVKE